MSDCTSTSPVACGLLGGVSRQELLDTGVERVLEVADLGRASRIWLINSLREWVDVSVVAGSPQPGRLGPLAASQRC